MQKSRDISIGAAVARDATVLQMKQKSVAHSEHKHVLHRSIHKYPAQIKF